MRVSGSGAARTPGRPLPARCAGCRRVGCMVISGRTVVDVPVDGRRVVVRVRVRRLVCPRPDAGRPFASRCLGVLERYQRRTARLTSHVTAVVKELAGRAGARLLARLMAESRRVTRPCACCWTSRCPPGGCRA